MSTTETEKLAFALNQISKDDESLTKLNDILSKATKQKIYNLSYELFVKDMSVDKDR